MRQPAEAEIGLQQIQMREQAVADARELPKSVGHAERGDGQGGRRGPVEGRRLRNRPVTPENAADDAEREYELPSQRIEKPASRFRPARQRQPDDSRGRIY